MGLRTTMAAASLIAGLPVVGLGRPAGAEAFDEFTDEVTFQRGGQPVTCSVAGNSAVHFVSGFSQIDVFSGLTDAEPACRDALSHIVSGGSYRVDDRSGSFFALAAAPQVSAHADVDGAVVSVDADHIFFFHCDDPRGHPCQFAFHTDPK